MANMKFVPVAGLAAATLLLAGCSMGTPKEGEMGPLGEYLNVLWEGQEYDQDYYDEQQRVEQELIAECMTKQGFEYTPDLQHGTVIFNDDDFEYDGPEWGTLEFAKKYGYGIIESPYNDMYPDDFGEGQEYFDPNEEYVMSLSDSERDAYYEALWGPNPTEEEWAKMEEEDNWEWNPENQGCYGEATKQSQANEPFAVWEDPEFENLMESMNLLYERIESDDRLVAIQTQWSTCMSEAGHPGFVERFDAQNAMYEEWNEFSNSLNENFDGQSEWKEPTEAQKQEFMQREIEVATADATCTQDANFEKTYQKVSVEYEKEFVEQHRAELDALVAKATQLKK